MELEAEVDLKEAQQEEPAPPGAPQKRKVPQKPKIVIQLNEEFATLALIKYRVSRNEPTSLLVAELRFSAHCFALDPVSAQCVKAAREFVGRKRTKEIDKLHRHRGKKKKRVVRGDITVRVSQVCRLLRFGFAERIDYFERIECGSSS
jgi:hypothetical protein